MAGAKIPKGAAADSYSYLPLLLNQENEYSRPPVIHHSSGGMFAIRDGDWKLILGNGSGGRQKPKGKPFARPYILYNIKEDPAEAKNHAETEAKITARLEATFRKIHQNERQ